MARTHDDLVRDYSDLVDQRKVCEQRLREIETQMKSLMAEMAALKWSE